VTITKIAGLSFQYSREEEKIKIEQKNLRFFKPDIRRFSENKQTQRKRKIMEQLWSNSQDGEQLWKACFEGHVEIVKLLSSDQRVDINQVNKNGQTPFSTACEKGHIEIVKYLLACGREIDINKKDKYGKTALDIARERSQVFDCQVLDSVFARVRNSNGNVATRMVVTVGHVQGLHFYCGRRADYRCYQCDGLCGPSNGNFFQIILFLKKKKITLN